MQAECGFAGYVSRSGIKVRILGVLRNGGKNKNIWNLPFFCFASVFISERIARTETRIPSLLTAHNCVRLEVSRGDSDHLLTTFWLASLAMSAA